MDFTINPASISACFGSVHDSLPARFATFRTLMVSLHLTIGRPGRRLWQWRDQLRYQQTAPPIMRLAQSRAAIAHIESQPPLLAPALHFSTSREQPEAQERQQRVIDEGTTDRI